MRLALGFGDVDQIGLFEARRQFQHRPGDRDVVVVRQHAQHLDRRIADRRQTDGELGARLVLDFLDQQPENVVEQVDMRVIEIFWRRRGTAR